MVRIVRMVRATGVPDVSYVSELFLVAWSCLLRTVVQL
jgi:hypothetical protein